LKTFTTLFEKSGSRYTNEYQFARSLYLYLILSDRLSNCIEV
jgi:hypothetical protein